MQTITVNGEVLSENDIVNIVKAMQLHKIANESALETARRISRICASNAYYIALCRPGGNWQLIGQGEPQVFTRSEAESRVNRELTNYGENEIKVLAPVSFHSKHETTLTGR